MTEPEITVYGAPSCPACRDSKMFLGEHQIPYRWVNIDDDAEVERFVMEMNGGRRIIPTIVFGDGSFLVQPAVADLHASLGRLLEVEEGANAARITLEAALAVDPACFSARGRRT